VLFQHVHDLREEGAQQTVAVVSHHLLSVLLGPVHLLEVGPVEAADVVVVVLVSQVDDQAVSVLLLSEVNCQFPGALLDLRRLEDELVDLQFGEALLVQLSEAVGLFVEDKALFVLDDSEVVEHQRGLRVHYARRVFLGAHLHLSGLLLLCPLCLLCLRRVLFVLQVDAREEEALVLRVGVLALLVELLVHHLGDSHGLPALLVWTLIANSFGRVLAGGPSSQVFLYLGCFSVGSSARGDVWLHHRLSNCFPWVPGLLQSH